MKSLFTTLALLASLTFNALAQSYTLKSPNKDIEMKVDTKENISWSVAFKKTPVLQKSEISMTLGENTILGAQTKVMDKKTKAVNKEFKPVVSHKDAIVSDIYNELTLTFNGNFQVQFRAYNDGVAYRFITDKEGEIEVFSETMNLGFPEGTTSYFPLEETMYSHYERTYIPTRLDTLGKKAFCSLPVMFDTQNGVKVLFSETDLHDYPAMFLEGNEDNSLHSIFPKYVLETIPNENSSPDRNVLITKEADYIAKTKGTRSFPWRAFIISDDDRAFVQSSMMLQLASPLEKEMDFSWVKPGRVAWDWYNANNVYGVGFESGINNDTYKYYIDFASKYGIEYVILDEGWTKSTTEILESNPEIDIPELIVYANKRNVDLILWVLWKPLDDEMDKVLNQYQAWGAKGIKVDFMQRADQYMVNSYEEIAKQCAQRQMLVDFHGAFKPAGLRRAYPNVISYEGVKGNENNKWSADTNPEHNVTIPFIRMAAGPMDYTPGAMRNANQGNFRISHFRPMSLGTRCHQLAMYVVYESPLQMYCDAPSAYLQEPSIIEFASQIPSVWDETVVLEAAVSDYIVLARRKDDKWYIGAMTDWTARDFSIDLSFLDDGDYDIDIMQDGVNAEKFGEDYKKVTNTVNQQSELNVHLAAGGGWAAILVKN